MAPRGTVENGGTELSERQSRNKFQTRTDSSETHIELENGKANNESQGSSKRDRTPTHLNVKKCILCACNFFMLMSVLGFMNGLGVLFVDIINTFNSTRAMGALIQSVYIGIVFGTGSVTGPVIRRLGCGPVCMGGGLLSTAGLIGSAYAPNLPVLIFTVGVVTGTGCCAMSMVPLVITGEVFDKRRNLAFTIVAIGPGVGALLFPLLNSFLVDQFGWRGTFLILAGVALQGTPIGMVIGSVGREIKEYKEKMIERDLKMNTGGDNQKRKESKQFKHEDTADGDVSKENYLNETKRQESKHRDRNKPDVIHENSYEYSNQAYVVNEKNREHSYHADISDINCSNKGASESVLMENNNKGKSANENMAFVDENRQNGTEENNGYIENSYIEILPNIDENSPAVLEVENVTRSPDVTDSMDKPLHGILKKRNASIDGLFKRSESRTSQLKSKMASLHCELFTEFSFIVLAVTVVLVTAMFPTINLFLVDMAVSRGLDAQTGSFFLSLIGFCNLAGRFLYLFIRPLLKWSQVAVFAVTCTILSVTVLSVTWAYDYNTFLAASICYGLPWGTVAVSYPALMFEVSGSAERYTYALGYTETMAGIGGLVGGPFAGSLKDITGSYNTVVYCSSVVGVICGVAFGAVVIQKKLRERSLNKETVTTRL